MDCRPSFCSCLLSFCLCEILGIRYLQSVGDYFINPLLFSIVVGKLGYAQPSAYIDESSLFYRGEIGHASPFPCYDIVPCRLYYGFSVLVTVRIVCRDFEARYAVVSESVDFGIFANVSSQFDSVQCIIHDSKILLGQSTEAKSGVFGY